MQAEFDPKRLRSREAGLEGLLQARAGTAARPTDPDPEVGGAGSPSFHACDNKPLYGAYFIS